MVYLTQVANDSWNVSRMKEYELRVGCVSNFTEDILIDERMGKKLKSQDLTNLNGNLYISIIQHCFKLKLEGFYYY